MGRHIRNIAALCALASGCTGALAIDTAQATGAECAGKPATIVGGSRGGLIRGTRESDVIVGGRGADVIQAGGGNDRVCSGGGNDRISGDQGGDVIDSGPGADAVDGGVGTDRIDAGPGPDQVRGDRGNDRIAGGPGADILSGNLGDESMSGGFGRDRLLGGLGNDRLHAGPGDGDLVRGDRGRDVVDGGPGRHDIASYAQSTAHPVTNSAELWVDAYDPYDDRIIHYYMNSPEPTGVIVNLRTGRASEQKAFRFERIRRIEDVIGSSFADSIAGDSGPNVIDGGGGADHLYGRLPTYNRGQIPFTPPFIEVTGSPTPGDSALGGLGSDECRGFASEQSCGPEAGSGGEATQVVQTRSLEGGSVAVTGGEAASDIVVSERKGNLVVTDPRGVDASDGCVGTGGTARCSLAEGIDTILVSPGPGDDTVRIDDSVPPGTEVRVDGGSGSDTLIGGRTADVLEGGDEFGFDVLDGRGGNDALTTGPGFDSLHGGGGSDLLIDAAYCSGHRFSGGPGVDSVSFARTGGVVAAIGGSVAQGTENDFRCYLKDHIDHTVENLEGSAYADTLVGDSGDNKIFGRGGNDRILGGMGADRLVGGAGSDALLGGAGFDRLFAKDGRRDPTLNCGPGSGTLAGDHGDPAGRGCR